MLSITLQWFLGLFESGLENSEKSDDIAVRCENINDFFTYSLYKNICRGLFEKSKLLFSFTLCVKLMQGKNRINAAELRFLLAGEELSETQKIIWKIEEMRTLVLHSTSLQAQRARRQLYRTPPPIGWWTVRGSMSLTSLSSTILRASTRISQEMWRRGRASSIATPATRMRCVYVCVYVCVCACVCMCVRVYVSV